MYLCASVHFVVVKFVSQVIKGWPHINVFQYNVQTIFHTQFFGTVIIYIIPYFTFLDISDKYYVLLLLE
jgi:hypothetical protein